MKNHTQHHDFLIGYLIPHNCENVRVLGADIINSSEKIRESFIKHFNEKVEKYKISVLKENIFGNVVIKIYKNEVNIFNVLSIITADGEIKFDFENDSIFFDDTNIIDNIYSTIDKEGKYFAFAKMQKENYIFEMIFELREEK